MLCPGLGRGPDEQRLCPGPGRPRTDACFQKPHASLPYAFIGFSFVLLPVLKVGLAGSAGKRSAARRSAAHVLGTLQAHYDLAGLDLHLLLGVDDQGEQPVCQSGLVPEEGLVQGLLVVMPLDGAVVGGVPTLAQALSEHQHLEQQTSRLAGLEEAQEVGMYLWAWGAG